MKCGKVELSFLLVPFNWCVLLIVLALLVRKRRIKKVLFIAAGGIFIFFSNTFIFQKVIAQWEYPAESLESFVENTEPIVVLGGMSSFNEQIDRVYFKEASDRLLQALWLQKMNPERQIIISGGSAEIYFEEVPEAKYLKDYLLTIGVAEDKLQFEEQSRNTFENARNTAALFDSLRYTKKITLITSAFHMKRAVACFEKQGFEVQPVATHVYTNHQPLKPGDYILPSLDTLQRWPIIIKEWVGLLVYQLKDYI